MHRLSPPPSSPPTISPHTVYYLPGFGGRIDTGLGAALTERGVAVTGRATVGEFRGLRFTEQVGTVVDDLRTHFWHQDARVVANSSGAYLFLHASLAFGAFPGRVLLLSPIVGAFADPSKPMHFTPPRPEVLLRHAIAGSLPRHRSCEVWVGQDDWQSVPADVQKVGAALGASVTVVPQRGHLLGADVVGPVLDGWL